MNSSSPNGNCIRVNTRVVRSERCHRPIDKVGFRLASHTFEQCRFVLHNSRYVSLLVTYPTDFKASKTIPRKVLACPLPTPHCCGFPFVPLSLSLFNIKKTTLRKQQQPRSPQPPAAVDQYHHRHNRLLGSLSRLALPTLQVCTQAMASAPRSPSPPFHPVPSTWHGHSKDGSRQVTATPSRDGISSVFHRFF